MKFTIAFISIIFLVFSPIMSKDKIDPKKTSNSKIVHVEVNLDFKGKNYKLVYTGAIVSESGHVLIPFSYEKKSITDAKLWYNHNEFSVKVLEVNEQVDIALLKFEPETKTNFYKIYAQPLSPKTDLVTLTTTSGEENFFNEYHDHFKFLGYYFGPVDFFVIGSLNLTDFFLPGSIATDKSGNLVGIVNDGRGRVILSMYDLNKHLNRMLKKSTNSQSKTNGDDKPFLGFTRIFTNKDYAEAKKLPASSVYVTAVFKNSPAEKGGLKAGDYITKVDQIALQGVNQNVERHFSKLLNPEIGENIEFQVFRDGKTLNLSFTFQKKPEPKELKIDELGLSFTEIQPEDYIFDDIFKETGILISKIEPGSPAATSNEFGSTLLMRTDVILAINDKPIQTIDDISEAFKLAKNSKKNVILIKVMRGLNTKLVAMKFKTNEVNHD